MHLSVRAFPPNTCYQLSWMCTSCSLVVCGVSGRCLVHGLSFLSVFMEMDLVKLSGMSWKIWDNPILDEDLANQGLKTLRFKYTCLHFQHECIFGRWWKFVGAKLPEIECITHWDRCLWHQPLCPYEFSCWVSYSIGHDSVEWELL